MTQRDNIIDILITIFAGIALGALVLCCFFSCRSQQVTTQTSGRDSIFVRCTYDTTYIQIYDTTRITVQQVEKTDEGTTIQFVSQGGTLNLQTGQVHGVATIRTNKQSKTDTQATTEWQRRVESLQATSDSLAQMLKCYQIVGQKTQNIGPKTRSAYDKFCSCFFWCVLIAGIIALALWLTNKRYGWWTMLRSLIKI